MELHSKQSSAKDPAIIAEGYPMCSKYFGRVGRTISFLAEDDNKLIVKRDMVKFLFSFFDQYNKFCGLPLTWPGKWHYSKTHKNNSPDMIRKYCL